MEHAYTPPASKQSSGNKPLYVAIAIIVAALSMFYWKFADEGCYSSLTCLKNLPSTSSAEWGQFGDFLGGLVNPFIGLLTVSLLVTSIKQQNAALAQNEKALVVANNELIATREEIETGRGIQKATEAGLRAQIELARNEGEVDFALKLIKTYDEEIVRLQSESLTGYNATERDAKIAHLERKTALLISLLDQRYDDLVDQLLYGQYPTSQNGEYRGFRYTLKYSSSSNIAVAKVLNHVNDVVYQANFYGVLDDRLIERRLSGLYAAYNGVHSAMNAYLTSGEWPSPVTLMPGYERDRIVRELQEQASSMMYGLDEIVSKLKSFRGSSSQDDAEYTLADLKGRFENMAKRSTEE